MKSTIIGVDLAKNVIQVCVVTNGKVIINKELSAQDFASWLASRKKAIVVFEACGTSNYWKQVALEYGHDAKLISAQLVSRIRQHQKTDKNDALAIVQASQLVDIQFIQVRHSLSRSYNLGCRSSLKNHTVTPRILDSYFH